ncbi:hypothetical protein [Calothrix sp. NIES-2098]|uniref:hypothetical protein n=1 Tax=Calothrix sp. NIES-2098 TaxID=1954171 RepID=UPI000B5DE0C3|nr:hypothetical protein NIES2098_23340 [Calothrix sp. NIES-2098]
MQERAIEILRLQNIELIESRTRFLESYADEVLEELELFTEPWMAEVAAATALTQAAQSAWLLDENRSVDIIERAASHYKHGAGLPYGYFLFSLISNFRDTMAALLDGPAVSMLEAIVSNEHPVREHLGEYELNSLHYPNQQVYLLLAFLSHREIANEFRYLIESALESLNVHGALPMGPHSVPLARYMKIAHLVWSLHSSPENIFYGRVRQEISPLLDLGFRYQESIEMAMRNRYLWQQMQSPVEIIDFDSVGLVTIFAGALSPALWEELSYTIQQEIPPLASISLQVANSFLRQRGNQEMRG